MGGLAFTKPRPLEGADVLDGFSCGLPLVDEWVRRHARTARRAGTAVVYVSFCDERLAGFYTLSSQSMLRSDARGWIARNAPQQIPVILLGMLGVDERFQGHGLGRNLLLDASKRALAVSEAVGARALVVDPAGEAAARLYRSCGFREIPGSDRMYARLR
ncbi:MAG: GNAT family N-acetyltransferase [Coriobacteriales bacterium]|nr:GNAT family N-acetyltransferase [Coriobacteriales bacterium]